MSGCFSYANIPKEYEKILGVTGTLEQLGEFEKEVISSEYKIKKSSYTPSVYGDSNLDFRKTDYVIVEKTESEYFLKLN